jgi:hypothetical protein
MHCSSEPAETVIEMTESNVFSEVGEETVAEQVPKREATLFEHEARESLNQ